MFLQSASIKNFHSIEDLRLAGCGRLNVLRGKNNAGKTNILNAIYAVFRCIDGGRVVALQPDISRELNFFNKHTENHIEVRLEFSLTHEAGSPS